MLDKNNNRDERSPHAPMRRPRNKYAFAIAMLSSATPLFLGYELAVVYKTAVMAQEDLKLVACTVALSSLLAVGGQRLIGDRRTVLLSAAVLCAGAITLGLASGFAAFKVTAGVFIHGVGIGLALTAIPAYAAELSPSSARRVLAAHPDGLVYLGCILGSVVYSMGWRLTVAIGAAAPALLSSVVVFMPETPRWLVSRDRESDARRLLSRMTSATLEEVELRLLEIQIECGKGKPHDGSDEPPAVAKRGRWWTEELGVLVHPTEPLRRAVLTALVAKVFQKASGIGPILQYVQQHVFRRDVDDDVSSRAALVVFGFGFLMSFPMSLVLVELGWLLVRAVAARGRCRLGRSVPTGSVALTWRRQQLKWARALSATMLLSLMALVWIALGPPAPCP